MSDDIVKRLREDRNVKTDRLEAANEIERLRAELAAEREKAFTAMRVFERYRELEAHVLSGLAERDTLRNLLWESREQLWLHGPDTLCARIDAALNKEDGNE